MTALSLFSASPHLNKKTHRTASLNLHQLISHNTRSLCSETGISRGSAFSRNLLKHRLHTRNAPELAKSSAGMQSLDKKPKNMSDELEEIDKKDALWSVSDFFAAKDLLHEQRFHVSYWEGEDSWAQMLEGDRVFGCMWKRYPLPFVEESESHGLSELRDKFSCIEIISVHSLSDPELIFSSDLALRLFDEIFEFPVSAESIWFSTNG